MNAEFILSLLLAGYAASMFAVAVIDCIEQTRDAWGRP